MELYHLHLKGNNDKRWRAHKEIVVSDKFENRLCKKCNNYSLATDTSDFPLLSAILNDALAKNGFTPNSDKANLSDLLDVYMAGYAQNRQEVINLLMKLQRTMNDTVIFKREMALENYRKDNNLDLPSRLHCIYATNEEGVNHWDSLLCDGDKELFRIDVLDEPFRTNDSFLPNEILSYKDIYDGAYRYWNPNFKKEVPGADEYLVRGKVKILEKVAEFRV